MINALITGVFNLVIGLVNLLLYPIDYAITHTLPGLSNAFELISDFFEHLSGVVPFVISYTGLTTTTIVIILELSVFILSAPIIIQTIKVAIKWYRTIKL